MMQEGEYDANIYEADKDDVSTNASKGDTWKIDASKDDASMK
jgi:hypothetical protein